MLKKFIGLGMMALLIAPNAYANNKTVSYALPLSDCKSFVGAWVGQKTFHFKAKEGGMLTVEDQSDDKLTLPSHSYSPSEGNIQSVGEVYNGLGYDFVGGDTKIIITSPKHNQYKLAFCNVIW